MRMQSTCKMCKILKQSMNTKDAKMCVQRTNRGSQVGKEVVTASLSWSEHAYTHATRLRTSSNMALVTELFKQK